MYTFETSLEPVASSRVPPLGGWVGTGHCLCMTGTRWPGRGSGDPRSSGQGTPACLGVQIWANINTSRWTRCDPGFRQGRAQGANRGRMVRVHGRTRGPRCQQGSMFGVRRRSWAGDPKCQKGNMVRVRSRTGEDSGSPWGYGKGT